MRLTASQASVAASLLALFTAAQSTLNTTALSDYLLPSIAGVSSDASTILGETISLPILDLTAVSNASHALIALNITKTLGAIGWIAVGFGSTSVHWIRIE